jgi:hypothetical protein
MTKLIFQSFYPNLPKLLNVCDNSSIMDAWHKGYTTMKYSLASLNYN